MGYSKYLLTAGITKADDKLRRFPLLLDHLLLAEGGFRFIEAKRWLEELIMEKITEAGAQTFIDTVQNLPMSNLHRWLQDLIHEKKRTSSERGLLDSTQALGTELSVRNAFHTLGCTKMGLKWLVDHQIIEILMERIEDDDEPVVCRQAYLWYLGLIACGSKDSALQVCEVGGIDAIAFVASVSSNFALRGNALIAMTIAANNEAVRAYLKRKHSLSEL